MPVYLYLIIFTLFFPLVLSFDKNVRFFTKWKFFFPSAIIPAFLFLIWDYRFTDAGVWGFNPEYLIGIYFLNLPVEEILFFLVVPFACVFIYECLNFYIKTDFLKPVANTISISLITLLFILGLLNSEKLYAAVNFLATGILLVIVLFFIKPKFMGRFYLSYIVSLIPFLLVNGILTYLPVVWYNDAHNLGIRLFSIPVEDFIYTLLKLLSYILMYEWVKSRFSNKVNFNAA